MSLRIINHNSDEASIEYEGKLFVLKKSATIKKWLLIYFVSASELHLICEQGFSGRKPKSKFLLTELIKDVLS
mgnify:CR=1 FL=1